MKCYGNVLLIKSLASKIICLCSVYVYKCVNGRGTDRIKNGFVISCEGILKTMGTTAAMSIDINFIFNSGLGIFNSGQDSLFW